MLADVQQLTLDRHYGKNIDAESILRKGWTKVLTIHDLSKLSAGAVSASATSLYEVWNADYDELGLNVKAKDRILAALEQVRRDTHEVLRGLD